MPRSSVENLRNLHGGLFGTEDATLQSMLDKAARQVIDDGINESHARFVDCQEAYASHLLSSAGIIGGPLASRSVGDVSVSFAQPAQGARTWMGEYRILKAGIRGIVRVV